METRPKIDLKLTTTDKLFEIVGWGALLSIWLLTLFSYSNLPNIIPVHYNGAGQVDRLGNKANILMLPFVATALFIGLTVLNKFPHIFNYSTEITEENAFRQYTNATRMLRYLKLIIVVIFGLIVFETIQNVNKQSGGLGIWFLPLTLGLIFIPLIYFIIQSFKAK